MPATGGALLVGFGDRLSSVLFALVGVAVERVSAAQPGHGPCRIKGVGDGEECGAGGGERRDRLAGPAEEELSLAQGYVGYG